MLPLVERVAEQIRRHGLLEEGDRVLVGLSGGADSIVLADVLLALEYEVDAVHVNYGLRGQASDGDEAFVRAWCAERGVRLVVHALDPADLEAEPGSSVQEAARFVRYASLARVARESGIEKIALGHHRDDQAETVLLNLFRGTGPEGLAGMPVMRPVTPACDIQIVRPLLSLSREEVESYARNRGLTWREDATNAKTIYRRGSIRSEILPLIERHFGHSVRTNIARSADLTREYVDETLQGVLEDAFAAALRDLDGRGSADLAALRRMSGVIRRRVLIEAVRRWLPQIDATSTRAAEIDGLLESQPGRRLDYGGGAVWRERDRLYFVPHDRNEGATSASSPTRLSPEDQAFMPGGIIRAELLPAPPRSLDSGSPNIVYVDRRVVEFPLIVRRWEPGDRFSPLGMEHSKKVSDFLTDEKVAPHAKASVYVVESGRKIVWVVGCRIAHEARVRDDAKETVQLSFRPSENSAPPRS